MTTQQNQKDKDKVQQSRMQMLKQRQTDTTGLCRKAQQAAKTDGMAGDAVNSLRTPSGQVFLLVTSFSSMDATTVLRGRPLPPEPVERKRNPNRRGNPGTGTKIRPYGCWRRPGSGSVLGLQGPEDRAGPTSPPVPPGRKPPRGEPVWRR